MTYIPRCGMVAPDPTKTRCKLLFMMHRYSSRLYQWKEGNERGKSQQIRICSSKDNVLVSITRSTVVIET